MSKIISLLTQKITKNHDLIEDWFAQKFKTTPANFYNSVDLRHCGFKIAPIDTNCFPAGFNNLGAESKEYAKIVANQFIAQNLSQKNNVKNILLIPENHTRNMRYLENIAVLQEILQNNQRQVVIGSLIDNLQEKTTIDLDNNKKITLNPIIKNNSQISTKDGFLPDLIILNNDLTAGIPNALQDLSIPIAPSISLGWYQRTKSHHFAIYHDLATEFSKLIDIDPWLISSLQRTCHDINFKELTGIKCLANYVDELIFELTKKYQEYEIKDQPYCYIKADNGTYGMAVMPVFSAEEILDINKKERNKMNMLKESTQNTMVMIQEGIKTIDKINNNVAEPMIYMIGGQVVGNLFRANSERDNLESLNASGASFFDLRNLQENQIEIGGNKNNIALAYSIIARLAALAAAQEDYNKTRTK